MSKTIFITSRFQSAARSIISFSSRQIRTLMAASASVSETDVQDDGEKDDASVSLTVSDEGELDVEPLTVTEGSANGSGSDGLDDGSSVQKQQLSVSSSPRMSALGQEKDCSVIVLLPQDQPKRGFHFSSWSNSDKEYRTRAEVVKAEKRK